MLEGQNGYTGGLVGNQEPIVIGGTNWANENDSGDLSKQKISHPFSGRIDEVAIYGQALAEPQIRQLITAVPLGVVGA